MAVAWNALAAMPNPGLAFAESFQSGLDKRKAEQKAQEKEWLAYLGNLAKWADTPEKWDQAVGYFEQSGYPDAAKFRGRFELREPLMARAGVAPPDSAGDPPQDPGIIREFDIARQRGLIPPETTYQQYVTLRNPGSQTPIILPSNVRPVGGGAQATPGAIVDDPRKGGTAGNGGGNFP